MGREQIEAIIEAAVLAPSAKNRQPWKYIVYTGESKAKLLEVMEAAVVIIVMNTNGKSPFEPIDADLRFAEISDSMAIGASIENMILKATELGLGTLWIANTCFAYEDMMRFIASPGQLIGAVAVGYANESPNPRPRKDMKEVLEYR